MNSLVGIVWSLINPEMFTSISDMIEDVMQASLPGLVENVRVADISQGENPIRILSLRAIPDSDVPDLKSSANAAREGRDPEQSKAEEDAGDTYNLEVSFAYNAAPTESRAVSGKTRNMHMQIIFYLGVRGVFDVPLRKPPPPPPLIRAPY
jgi:Ca2+-dependent lipid-binding protein